MRRLRQWRIRKRSFISWRRGRDADFQHVGEEVEEGPGPGTVLQSDGATWAKVSI